MAFVTHTVTGDLRQMFGDAIDITQVAGFVETNLSPGQVMVFDLDDDTQRLGSGKLTINADGTWSLTGVPAWENTEADQNPTHVQIQVRFEYTDKVTRQRTKWLSGFLEVDHDGSIGEFVAQQLAPADWRSDFMDAAEALRDETEAYRDETRAIALGDVPSASTTARGTVELATNTETAAGADTVRGITPAALRYSLANGAVGNDLKTTYARQVSTDGTGGLPAPTGVGMEMVVTADGLDDIRLNGVSL